MLRQLWALHLANSIQTSLPGALRLQIALRRSNSCELLGRNIIGILAVLLLMYSSAVDYVMAAPPNDESKIIHISLSPLDQWFQCVRNVTGKPLVSAFGGWTFLGCPNSVAELTAQLKGKGILVPGEKWDLLIGKTYVAPDETPPGYWQSVAVDIKMHSWEGEIPGSRHPTATELNQLSEAALKVIRPFLPIVQPIAPKGKAGPEQSSDHAANFQLEMLFDIHQLTSGGPESIVGIFRQADVVPDGRLIYGEYRDGKPVFLWDSPLFSTRFLSLAYKDVDGDGTQEILLRAEEVCRSSCKDLVIFTTNGAELSRQVVGDSGFVCMEGHACPIGGGEFHFIDQGRRAADRIEVEWPEGAQPSDVYLFESGRTYRKQVRRAVRSGRP